MTSGAAPAVPAGLVRVTVVGGPRRVDLALPGGVPVADLVPELARSVGLLGPDTAHAGHALVGRGGRRLQPGSGLLTQGVADGALLTVVTGADAAAPRVYDDVAEAMADAVSSEVAPWEPASARRAAAASGVLLVGLSAVALLVVGGGRISLAVAGALVVAAVAGERSGLAERHVSALGGLAALHAAVAGLLLVGGDGWSLSTLVGAPLVAAGAGAGAAGLGVSVGVRSGRTRQLPAVLVGSALALVGGGTALVGADPATVLPLVLASVVLAGSLTPWLALGVTGTGIDQVVAPADVVADPDPIDPARVHSDARSAHDLLLAVTASVGTLVVLLTPAVVVGAPTGAGAVVAAAILAAAACLAVLLRARHCRGGAEVVVCVTSGVVGLVAAGASALVVHEAWGTGVAAGAAGLGCVVLAAGVRPRGPSARRARLLDLLESTVLLALLPLAVLASGLLARAIG